MIKRINILADPPLVEVLRLSLSRGLTIYDASYVYAAESMGMTLVTEDKQILSSTRKAINFKGFIDAITRNDT